MPKLGPSMEQATVVRWHKSAGDNVRQGDIIVDIETEKTVHEIEAEADGVLHETRVPEGQSCVVGAVLAVFGAAGEKQEAAPEAVARTPAGVVSEALPWSIDASSRATAQSHETRRILIKSSPAARRVAREKRVDLSRVAGTGPRGRIVSEDVIRAASAAGAQPAATHLPANRTPLRVPMESDVPAAAAPGGHAVKERRPLTSARRVIAERMARSKQSAPHFYVGMDVDMTRVKETRESWKAAGESPVPSYNDFVIWAAARALRSFPELNASLVGEELVIYSDINIGMATSAPDGLVVPVIRRADRLSVRGVASSSAELAGRARDRKLLPDHLEGATFTISNLGMFGVDSFSAIINPPQSAILAVGQVAPRVVTDGHSITIRTLATVTVSVDHRVADGVLASLFLGAFKQSLEAFREGE